MASTESEDRATVSPVDVRLLALAVVLEPALSLARVTGLDLDDLNALVSVGYLREFQRRGMSLRGMRKRVGKSLRTLARLSKQATEEGPPLEGSERIGWRRRIVRRLAQAPADLEVLAAGFPDATASEVAEAADELVELGILTRDGDRYVVASAHLSLVREDLDHRLESLRHFLGAVAHVVYRRFYRPEADTEAFARVFTFSVPKDHLPLLRQRVYDVLREEVFAADAAAEAGGVEVVQASAILSCVESPTDLAWRTRR